ncbi:MAG: HlyD family efflux transporter periplasmic adaptor subunit [Phycisphaerales bacterium]
MVYLPRALAVCVLLLIAAAIAWLMWASREQNDPQPPRGASLTVRALDAVQTPTDRVWSGYGTVRTMNSADIVAEVGGRVIERPEGIEAGVRVDGGDLLIRIDDSDYLNALDSARQAARSLEAQIEGLQVEQEQAALQVSYATDEIAAAQRDLARIDEAIAAGAGSVGERDTRLASLLRAQRELSMLQQQLELIPSRRMRLEAELSAQRAAERTARENLQRATIQAPFDAELQMITPRAGDWVAAGTVVARLVDLSRLEIPLRVPASASAWVRPGDEARLWVDEPGVEPDQIGSVSRIAPEADPASRTMTVFIEVRQDPTDTDRLLPGQFVFARLVTNDPHDRVVLPRRAVQSGRVFIAGPLTETGRTVETVLVRVAYSFEAARPELDPVETQWVALEPGFEPEPGSAVIVSLLDQVVPGMKVRLQRDPEPEPANPDSPAAEPEAEGEGQG